jgi:hypothetical protein
LNASFLFKPVEERLHGLAYPGYSGGEQIRGSLVEALYGFRLTLYPFNGGVHGGLALFKELAEKTWIVVYLIAKEMAIVDAAPVLLEHVQVVL